MDRMISTLNILRFAKLYQMETNVSKRSTLKRLLIEEEDRLGACYERLDLAQKFVTEGADRIARQQNLIATLKDRGYDTGAAERHLDLLQECNQLFKQIQANCRAISPD